MPGRRYRIVFDRIRYRRHDASAFLYAFDLIELDGEDLRRDPLAVRKATLARRLPAPHPAYASMSISIMRMARWCLRTPASSGWRASCQSARTRAIVPAITGTFVLSVNGGDKILHTIN
jgi:hypothetical protein